jgi:hypothetical protein
MLNVSHNKLCPPAQALAKADWLDYNPSRSGRGSARLERTVRVREVPSSNLGAPTNCGLGSKSPLIYMKEISILIILICNRKYLNCVFINNRIQ